MIDMILIYHFEQQYNIYRKTLGKTRRNGASESEFRIKVIENWSGGVARASRAPAFNLTVSMFTSQPSTRSASSPYDFDDLLTTPKNDPCASMSLAPSPPDPSALAIQNAVPTCRTVHKSPSIGELSIVQRTSTTVEVCGHDTTFPSFLGTSEFFYDSRAGACFLI